MFVKYETEKAKQGLHPQHILVIGHMSDQLTAKIHLCMEKKFAIRHTILTDTKELCFQIYKN